MKELPGVAVTDPSGPEGAAMTAAPRQFDGGAHRASSRDASERDYYPTPPWATRALLHELGRLHVIERPMSVWDPAAGGGHMAGVFRERMRPGRVFATDIDATPGAVDGVHDFLSSDLPACLGSPNRDGTAVAWVVTNPPFRLAEAFALRALNVAALGVALLCRVQFLEGAGRYRRLFKPCAPSLILPFSERVPMFKGRLDPTGSTTMAYAWFVWCGRRLSVDGTLMWHIPPGTRARFERALDYADVPDGSAEGGFSGPSRVDLGDRSS